MTIKKVWLDAGHGGKDSGGTGNGIQEKDVVLAVVLEVGKILQKHGLQVGYSRTDDRFIELSQRSIMANRYKADLFVSVHTNAFSKETARGLETFSFPNSKDGATLASNIHNSIKEAKLYSIDRGLKTSDFSVLRETHMNAVLLELGFVTNVGDSLILKTKLSEMAVSIAKGILQYSGIPFKLGVAPVKPVTPVKPVKPVESVDSSHWVDDTVSKLEAEGIQFTDKRYDNLATRAEVIQMMYLMYQKLSNQ